MDLPVRTSYGFAYIFKMRNCMRPGEDAATRPLGVVVTGGSAGLGLAMARLFLLAGDRVVICGRDHNRLEAALGHFESRCPEANCMAWRAMCPRLARLKRSCLTPSRNSRSLTVGSITPVRRAASNARFGN